MVRTVRDPAPLPRSADPRAAGRRARSPNGRHRPPRDRGRVPWHPWVLLLGGAVGLLLGVYTGLARGGTDHRYVAADLHGLLMVLGFLGTVIALERAVAHGRRWGYLGPVLSSTAVLALPFSRPVGGTLLTAAGMVVLATYVSLLHRSGREPHLTIMAIGAVAWIAATVLWLAGAGPIRITPLLAAFLVLTIVGERLELSRLSLPSDDSRRRFLLAVAVFVVGAAIAPFWRPVGLTIGGIGMLGQVVWLGRYDLARRTVRRPGLPRFAAVCLLSGYVWMAVSGLLWTAMGFGATGLLLHDALVHSLFLGFVLSMVMGHAPIIVPAVLRVPLRFIRSAYVPLVLLHVSVTVRIVADLAGSLRWREVALHGNVTALVLFVVTTMVAVRGAGRDTTGKVAT